MCVPSRLAVQSVRAVFAFMSLLLLAHLVACGWWLAARLETAWDAETYTWARQAGLDTGSGFGADSPRLLEQYFTCMYWSLATLISIGFGGSTNPTTGVERLYTLAVVLFAALAYAQVVATFMLVVNNVSRADRAHRALCHDLEAHMRRHAFPPALRARVLAYQHAVRTYLDAHIGREVFLRAEEEERFSARAAAKARDIREHFRGLEARLCAEHEARWEEQWQAHAADPAAVPPPPPLPSHPLDFDRAPGAPPPQPGSTAWLLECASQLDELREDSAATPVASSASWASAGGGGGGGANGGSGGNGSGGSSSVTHMRSEDKILSTLPQSYALELTLHLHGSLVHSVPLLRDLPSSVLGAIAQALRVGIWVRGDFICKARGAGAGGCGPGSGLGGRAMFLLKRGKVQEAQWSDLAKRVALAQKALRLEQESAARGAALRAAQQRQAANQREKNAHAQHRRGEHKSPRTGAAGAPGATAATSVRAASAAEAKCAAAAGAEGKAGESRGGGGQGDSCSLPSFAVASSPSLSSRLDSSRAPSAAAGAQSLQTQTHLSPHASLLASPLSAHALARPSLRTHGPGFDFGLETLVRAAGTHSRDVRVVSAVAEVAVLDLAAFLRVCETFPSFARCICAEVERRERSLASRREKEARTVAEVEATMHSKAKAATRNRAAHVGRSSSPLADQRSLPLDACAAAAAAAPTGATPSSASGRVVAGAAMSPSGVVRARLSASRPSPVDVAVE